MGVGLWKAFFSEVKADPMATRILKGNPLVIANSEGNIVYAGRVQIEKRPLGDFRFSFATLPESGEVHQLTNAENFLAPSTIHLQTMLPYDRLQRGNRGGDAYIGDNENQEEEIWYLDSAADAYLLEINRLEGNVIASSEF